MTQHVNEYSLPLVRKGCSLLDTSKRVVRSDFVTNGYGEFWDSSCEKP